MEKIKKIKLDNETKHKTFFPKENQEFQKRNQNPLPALFLDRDGVIIKDCHYIKNAKDVEVLPGLKKLISRMNTLCWNIVVVSNQSGISRGYFSWDDYDKINLEMMRQIGTDCNIDAIYASGDSPLDLKNNWRKPSPRMFYEAKKDLNISLKDSIIIGDRITDLIAGQKAGLKLLVHVLTGHGERERAQIIKYYGLRNDENSDKPFFKELKNTNQKILFVNNLLALDQNIFLN